MKYFKYTIYSLALVLLIFAAYRAHAQSNPLLNFTGKVTNTNGSELADGNYDFIFRLYDAPTGGNLQWTETLDSSTRFSGVIDSVSNSSDGIVYTYNSASATSTFRVGQYLTNSDTLDKALIVDYDASADTVTVASSATAWSAGDNINNRPFVEGGVININLGSVSDISGVDFSVPQYLEVIFNSETMQPRKRMTTVSQAFSAVTLGGKTQAELATLSENEIITGEWSFNNIVGISTSSASTAFTVTQNGSGKIMEVKRGTSTALAVLNDGRVQIGDYIFPASRTGSSAGYVLKIDASGELYWANDFVGGFGTSAGDMLWATSTDESMIYPVDTNYVVVVGNNATTSPYDIIFEVDGYSWFDNIGISNQQELRFYDSDSTNYMALRATGTLGSNLILTLPGSAGLSGQTLLTDGNGNLYWGLPSGLVGGTGIAGQIAIWQDESTIEASSSLSINVGGTGAITAAGARDNLGLTEIYTYAINEQGSMGQIWIASGSGRGGWFSTSTLGIVISDITGVLPVIQGGTGSTTLGGILKGDGSNAVVSARPGVDYYAPGGSAISLADGGTGATLSDPGTTDMLMYWDDSGSTVAWLSTSTLGIALSDTTGTLEVGRGGTGATTFTADGILYGNGTNAIQATAQGTNNYILYSNAGTPDWIATGSLGLLGLDTTLDDLTNVSTGGKAINDLLAWDGTSWTTVATNSLGIDFSDLTGTLEVSRGGTGLSAISDGFVLIGTGVNVLEATSTIFVSDSGYVGIGSSSPDQKLSVAGYGSFAEGICIGSDCITGWGESVISGSGVNGTVAVWTDAITLAASSTLSINVGGTGANTAAGARTNLGLNEIYTYAINEVGSLGQVWLASGSGRGGWLSTSSLGIDISDTTGILPVERGGLGITSITNQSLIYASSDNTLNEFTIGNEGEVLAVVGGNLTWATTSAPTAHPVLSVYHSDVEATSTLVRGDLMYVGSNTKWNRLGLGPSGYILYSNGTDVGWSTTTAITALGTIVQGTWNAGTIDIAYGGTGATTATGARENLDLSEIYEFGIDSAGATGYVWQSDGDGRGRWVATSSLGITEATDIVFIGTTTSMHNGEFSTSTLRGYQAANDICATEFTNSFFCRTYDILVSINERNISNWGGSAWIAEGPPGYTSNSNDCNGWVSSSSIMLGAFWAFDSSGGGAGWLTNCSGEKPIACCSKQ